MITIPQISLLDSAALAAATATNYAASVYAAQWSAFWSRPNVTIAANIADEPEKAAALMSLTLGAAAFCNAALDAFSSYTDANGQAVFTHRVSTVLPDGWLYNAETGQFTFLP